MVQKIHRKQRLQGGGIIECSAGGMAIWIGRYSNVSKGHVYRRSFEETCPAVGNTYGDYSVENYGFGFSVYSQSHSFDNVNFSRVRLGGYEHYR